MTVREDGGGLPGAVRLSPGVRQGYGSAAFAIAVANSCMMFFLLKFLVDGAGLAPATAGTVLMLGKAWDAITDPVAGRLCDRTRSPIGPRRAWILGGSVPWILLFALLWVRPPVSGLAAAAWAAVMLVLYNTAYTVVVVPYGALTPVLTRDYDERTRLNAARMAWSMAGGLVAGIGMPVLQRATGSHAAAAAILAVLMVPPVVALLAVTRGRDRAAEVGSGGAPFGVLGVRAFRRVAGLFLAGWVVVASLSAILPFYVQHVVGRPDRLEFMLAAVQLSALAFIPAVARLAQRTEKHRAYAAAMASWAVVMVVLSLLPEGAFGLVVALGLLAGFGIAAAHVLPWSMLPDVVEADRVDHGVERAGAFYGMMTFIEKIGVALALWGLGLGLQAAGYVEGAATQPAGARLAIRLLVGPAPALVLGLGAAAALLWPPVTREAHRAMLLRIASRARRSGPAPDEPGG